MVFSIFGKNIKFMFESKIDIEQKLIEELSLYPRVENHEDVIIKFVDQLSNEEYISMSPPNHITFYNGFIMKYGYFDIKFKKEEQLMVEISIRKSDWLRKWISMDFNNTIESIGEIIHELVLVPIVHFFDDLAIVHASSFKNLKTGEVYMIGGTGGVGKTTSEIVFCSKEYISFISDDIAVIDKEGDIYPNLSFPKIYAYNLSGNNILSEEKILKLESIPSRIHWKLMKKLRGLNKVRRRISPEILYEKYENTPQKITKYFILSRNNCVTKIEVNKINNSDLVTELSHKIILNEYDIFYKHVRWYEYNCLLNNFEPIINMKIINNQIKNVLNTCFSKIENYLLYIPHHLSHTQFLENIEKIIK